MMRQEEGWRQHERELMEEQVKIERLWNEEIRKNRRADKMEPCMEGFRSFTGTHALYMHTHTKRAGPGFQLFPIAFELFRSIPRPNLSVGKGTWDGSNVVRERTWYLVQNPPHRACPKSPSPIANTPI